MSSAPPNGLLKAELQHVKAINAELLAALERAIPEIAVAGSPDLLEQARAAIRNAKAQP